MNNREQTKKVGKGDEKKIDRRLSHPSFAPGSQARMLFDITHANAKSQFFYSPMQWTYFKNALESAASPLPEYHADKYIRNRCGVCGVPWADHSPDCPGRCPSNSLPT